MDRRGPAGAEGRHPDTRPDPGTPCPLADPARHIQDYFFYLSSNRKTPGGVHIDMSSYEKIYNITSESGLPDTIFLDKGNSYRFGIFLTARENLGLWAGLKWKPRGGWRAPGRGLSSGGGAMS